MMDVNNPPDFSRQDASTAEYMTTHVFVYDLLNDEEKALHKQHFELFLETRNMVIFQQTRKVYLDSFFRRNGFRLTV